jgi:hypothetical protein
MLPGIIIIDEYTWGSKSMDPVQVVCISGTLNTYRQIAIACAAAKCTGKNIPTPAGFEPAPSKRNRFLICRCNHLAIAPSKFEGSLNMSTHISLAHFFFWCFLTFYGTLDSRWSSNPTSVTREVLCRDLWLATCPRLQTTHEAGSSFFFPHFRRPQLPTCLSD